MSDLVGNPDDRFPIDVAFKSHLQIQGLYARLLIGGKISAGNRPLRDIANEIIFEPSEE